MLQATSTLMTNTAADVLEAIMQDQVNYNLWANTRLIDFLRSKEQDLMEREVASSYAGIKATLLHIWDCQDWWLINMKNGDASAPRNIPNPNTATVAEVMEGLLAHSLEMVNYVNKMAKEKLNETCLVAIPFTGDYLIPRFQMLQQVTMHSVYHRGQVVTIGRQLGFTDAPNTDYMYYMLLGKNI
ncbi:putative damage-inducible protein DinB [Chitinophaga dinghuensis]|uniref:Putative damage-inducible protein DinB n=1 Tax=Chitinophaga dinghuensis TaxID=1539050 RepID=A0A327VKQ8_9BACT|nr:DinB family protein [Chitinophaga dinghuensis]RAJ75082.1 putative damage-inducible protein DinB [Chitinophaga dinghuensis]